MRWFPWEFCALLIAGFRSPVIQGGSLPGLPAPAEAQPGSTYSRRDKAGGSAPQVSVLLPGSHVGSLGRSPLRAENLSHQVSVCNRYYKLRTKVRLEDFSIFPCVLLLQYQGEIKKVKKIHRYDTPSIQTLLGVRGAEHWGGGSSTAYRTDQTGRFTCGYQGGKEWGGNNWETGADVHTLLNTK